MKPGQLQNGMTVYDVQRRKMGNTRISTVAVFPVQVVEVLDGAVRIKWNGNTPHTVPISNCKSWRIKKPETIETGLFGQRRLATKKDKAEK